MVTMTAAKIHEDQADSVVLLLMILIMYVTNH